MPSEHVGFALEDGVAIITLNRPEKRNAFSAQMGAELGDAYRRCDADDDIRAVVLTGAPPAFCAGADLSRGADTFTPREGSAFDASPVTPTAWQVRKPVIAAVNGHAIGLGLTLALQCDLRFVADGGSYGVVQVRRGIMPDAYSHWTVTRAAGLAVAAEVLLTGRTFSGAELVALGLASRCLPAPEVLPAAVDVARDMAVNAAPVSVAVSKRLLWKAADAPPEEVGRLETELHLHLLKLADAREGPTAFIEGRRPKWTGRVSTDFPEGL